MSSVVAAGAVARGDAQQSQRAFRSTSATIASTLQLAVEHEEDLIIAASGFVIGNPDASNSQFLEWATSVRALERYPELLGFGHSVIVPASGLAEFAARAIADPSGPLAADGTFQVVPPGERPFYCLAVVGVSRPQLGGIPVGSDFCASDPDGEMAVRDSGQSVYSPLTFGTTAFLAVQIPIYRAGAAPNTVDARRAAFLGWVGMTLDPTIVLDRALQGHPNVSVTMRYEVGASHVEFTRGEVPQSAKSVTIDLNNGWTVHTSTVLAPSSIVHNRIALELLMVGTATSFLLAALGFVLATGRARALRLVAERTGDLHHQALHDALTGLPNRALIMDRIDQLLARNRRHGTNGAALYVDLDDFKNVNDTLGHAAGDRLLLAVAARLTTALRDVDTVGRMGGDEFVVLIDGAQGEIAPELGAERLLEVMRQPFQLEGAMLPLTINVSIGLAIGDRATSGDLLRDADVALYQAKEAGKNRYEIFRPEMQANILRRVELDFDLRGAVDSEQFHLVYLPIYNLDDLAVVGVEALLRWDRPTLAAIEPSEFIPVLEQSGQINEVGRWVLLTACEQMAAWHARGDRLDISVNVSGRQLDHDSIVDDISHALAVSGLDATTLIIEVAETALMQNTAATARRLRAIKELGVKIAVDDFGTGYSSLAYLQQFPVDCLKIDRTFVNAITTSPESRSLIGTLVQLGRDLGLRTLAEGVETTGQIDQLRAEHVNEAQGFLLSRPLDPQTLEAQLLAPTRPQGSVSRGDRGAS